MFFDRISDLLGKLTIVLIVLLVLSGIAGFQFEITLFRSIFAGIFLFLILLGIVFVIEGLLYLFISWIKETENRRVGPMLGLLFSLAKVILVPAGVVLAFSIPLFTALFLFLYSLQKKDEPIKFLYLGLALIILALTIFWEKFLMLSKVVYKFYFGSPEKNIIHEAIDKNRANSFEGRSIREILEDRQKKIANEKPILIIDLESRKAPMKASDIMLISNIMSFAWIYASMSKEQALDYSILTFVLSKSGTDQEKKEAKATIDNAWNWSLRQSDLEQSIKIRFVCADIIKKHFGIS